MSLLQALNWRYAVKRMNGTKVPQEKIDNILEATRLSASSMGLQPYTVVVVENEELRNKIKPIAMNQPQITEASHLLIFAAWDDITEQQIDEYVRNIVETRGVPAESMADYRNIMVGHTQRMTQEQRYQWAARQAYIAFGTAIAAAASESVDATPMEGFDPAALDELLGLKEKGLRSVTLLPLGYRDEQNDFLFGAKKVRRSKDELILELA
jgi:nitroreductase